MPDKLKTKYKYEIILIALNEETREIAFFECKWKGLRKKQTDYDCSRSCQRRNCNLRMYLNTCLFNLVIS